MNDIVSENYFDLLVDSSIIDLLGKNNINKIYKINPKQNLVLQDSKMFSMCQIGLLTYSVFPSLFTLNAYPGEDSNVGKVQDNPNLKLFGQGVLLAIIDTGIDYIHKAFRNSDGSTRIHSIWDQTINEDNNPPEGFIYGTEYDKDTINMALRNDNPLSIVNTVDDVGHGTMIAGIAGGTPDIDNNFKGVASNSEYIIVKLKEAKKLNKEIFCVPEDKLCYMESDVIAGLTYAINIATKLHRPMIVCLAMGTSQGAHTGFGATSGYLNYLTQTPGVGVVVAAGNEGNKRRHFYGVISVPYYTDVELNVGENDKSFSVEFWAASPYRLSIDVISPTGESKSDIFPRLNECLKLSFVLSQDVAYVNNIITESDTGDQLILIRFQNISSGIWRFRLYSIDQINVVFNGWLPAGDLISNETYFLNSDPNTTVTSPGNADSPLTVANYNSVTNSINNDSGRGYTPLNNIKPNLSAPGYNIRCPIPNGRYSSATGTGVAAANTAGIMAMIMEWAIVKGNYTGLTGNELNKILIRGAYRRDDTDYPNRMWGYGAIDTFGAFEKLTFYL